MNPCAHPDFKAHVTVNRLTDTGCFAADVRIVKGELYPCKPDIFAATYEPTR